MEEELKILFYALCDGLRQEVRQRYLAKLVSGEDFSLVNEREQGVASSLAVYLRSVGFMVQLESYYSMGSRMLRPDYCIWLPVSKKYIYLELKLTGWGYNCQYYYQGVINNIKKIDEITEFNRKTDLGKGIIAIGFSRMSEKLQGKLWQGFERLSNNIDEKFTSYKKVKLESVDLRGIDVNTSYAIIGMWFHKYQ